MAHDWRTPLWNQFRKRVEEQGEEKVRFPVFYERRLDQKFMATLVGKKLRVVVTPEVSALVEALDSDEVENRLVPHRVDYWRQAYRRLVENAGLSVELNTLGVGVLVPTFRVKRTSAHLNVYRSFYVDPADLEHLLTSQQLLLVGTSSKKKTLTLAALGRLLFPPVEQDAALDDELEEADEADLDTIWTRHRNVIFFGPPGTGKSYQIREIVAGHLAATPERTVRVTFHPETSYFDFVGSYRPAVGWVQVASQFEDADGTTSNREPRTYYRFEPGPLSLALSLADSDPATPAVLVIEEINRGNVAAVFGDVFQLLDRSRARKNRGWSEYAITPSGEWGRWLSKHCSSGGVYSAGRLALPPNLYLYATMNTSDQSLYPMDTAFRRRWGMQYVGIRGNGDPSVRVPLHRGDKVGVVWLKLMALLNRAIVEHTRNDDKQMGPFFVRTLGEDLVPPLEFQSKVLFYLWSEVFRERPEQVFRPEIRTWEGLVGRFEAGLPVLRDEIAGAAS